MNTFIKKLTTPALTLGFSLASTTLINAQSAWEITKKSWDGYSKKDWQAVEDNANHAVASWGNQARSQNDSLSKLPKGKKAHQLNFLNGVATAVWLKGEALREQGNIEGALAAYYTLVTDFYYGQCWDDSGWFWHPGDQAKGRIEELSPNAEKIKLETAPLDSKLAFPGKKGICFTLRKAGQEGGRDTNIKRIKATKPAWYYSWGSELISQHPSEIEFVPMIWGAWNPNGLAKTLEQQIQPQIADGQTKRLLGFNEPDLNTQSNMSVKDALKFWPQLESVGVPLCSPACANPLGDNDSSNQGVHGTWMRDFIKEADKRNYRVDYIGVHWYGGTSAYSFKKRMIEIYKAYGNRPLVISEFAVADWGAKKLSDNKYSEESILEFMKDVLPWIEQQNWIAAYAWFSFEHNQSVGHTSSLFDKNGNLTTLGKYYTSITTENPSGDQSIK